MAPIDNFPSYIPFPNGIPRHDITYKVEARPGGFEHVVITRLSYENLKRMGDDYQQYCKITYHSKVEDSSWFKRDSW